MEVLFKKVNYDYLRGYRAVSRIVLEEFNDAEQALIAEYYADTTSRERKLEINQGQTTDDFLFTLEAVRCIGCCASGPVITVNQNTHGGLDHSSAVKVVEEYEQNVS